MLIIRLIVGLCLLLLGRKLFWVFVAAIGFFAGLRFAAQFAGHQPETTLLLIALGCGLAGALIAIFLQKIAIGLAGFGAGSLLFVNAAQHWGVVSAHNAWIAGLAGGIAGALLMVFLFNWALIILSSLLGAALIAEILPLHPTAQAISFLVLVILGVISQLQLRTPRAVQG